jgi:hypothetical protein
MHAAFKHFESTTKSWDSIFADAAAFATEIGKERLIGISHSHGGGTEFLGAGGTGVVTVWFWTNAASNSE